MTSFLVDDQCSYIHRDSDSSTKADRSTATSSSAESHKNEGFLKAAWHKLTHQHDNLPPDEPKAEDKSQDEEPKKASGSG